MSRQKIYYPPGQIQTGLYTQGGEWMFEDGEEYIGPYHTYSTGEVFSGSRYNTSLSKKLIRFVDLSVQSFSKKFQYDSIRTSEIEEAYFPTYSKVTPTLDNYSNGYVDRFFVKRKHQDFISEVDSKVYSQTQSTLFEKTKIRWKLTGINAVDVNITQVRKAEKTIEGISNYITNYSEFVKV